MAESGSKVMAIDTLFFVGDALLWGKGVASDRARALKMLDKAALQGCPNAYHTIKSINQNM